MTNSTKFIELTSELVPFIQRMQSTIACVSKSSHIDLNITDEELELIENALATVKDVRERALSFLK